MTTVYNNTYYYLPWINSVRNYRTYEEISQALKVQEVKGALVDLYVLSSHKHLFDDPRFRIVRVYDYKASYGVVLAGHSMKLEDCFTEHIKAFTASVFQKIEENVKESNLSFLYLMSHSATSSLKWFSNVSKLSECLSEVQVLSGVCSYPHPTKFWVSDAIFCKRYFSPEAERFFSSKDTMWKMCQAISNFAHKP